jgi:hypothetical protein
LAPGAARAGKLTPANADAANIRTIHRRDIMVDLPFLVAQSQASYEFARIPVAE